MPTVLVISAADNVATALEDLEAGARVDVGGQMIAIAERIPRGHKVALQAIPAGREVIKYGSPIGSATVDIRPGTHVHIHNVASARGRGDLAARAHGLDEAAAEQPTRAPGGRPPGCKNAAAEPRLAEPPDSAVDRESETVS